MKTNRLALWLSTLPDKVEAAHRRAWKLYAPLQVDEREILSDIASRRRGIFISDGLLMLTGTRLIYTSPKRRISFGRKHLILPRSEITSATLVRGWRTVLGINMGSPYLKVCTSNGQTYLFQPRQTEEWLQALAIQ